MSTVTLDDILKGGVPVEEFEQELTDDLNAEKVWREPPMDTRSLDEWANDRPERYEKARGAFLATLDEEDLMAAIFGVRKYATGFFDHLADNWGRYGDND